LYDLEKKNPSQVIRTISSQIKRGKDKRPSEKKEEDVNVKQ
jgi:hypothetical protein